MENIEQLYPDLKPTSRVAIIYDSTDDDSLVAVVTFLSYYSNNSFKVLDSSINNVATIFTSILGERSKYDVIIVIDNDGSVIDWSTAEELNIYTETLLIYSKSKELRLEFCRSTADRVLTSLKVNNKFKSFLLNLMLGETLMINNQVYRLKYEPEYYNQTCDELKVPKLTFLPKNTTATSSLKNHFNIYNESNLAINVEEMIPFLSSGLRTLRENNRPYILNRLIAGEKKLDSLLVRVQAVKTVRDSKVEQMVFQPNEHYAVVELFENVTAVYQDNYLSISLAKELITRVCHLTFDKGINKHIKYCLTYRVTSFGKVILKLYSKTPYIVESIEELNNDILTKLVSDLSEDYQAIYYDNSNKLHVVEFEISFDKLTTFLKQYVYKI